MLQIFNHQMTPANIVLKPAEVIRYLKKHKTKPMFLFMSTLLLLLLLKSLQSCPTLCNPIDGSPPEHWSGVPLPSPLVNRNSDIISTIFTLIFLNRVPFHIFSLLSQCLCWMGEFDPDQNIPSMDEKESEPWPNFLTGKHLKEYCWILFLFLYFLFPSASVNFK